MSSGPPVDILDTSSAGPTAIRGGALQTAGYAGGLLVALASVPLLVRHLGAADFGRYSTVVSLVAIVGGISDVGIATIAVREFAATEGPRRVQMMRRLLGLRLLVTGVGVTAAVAFAALAGYGGVLVLGTLLAGLGLVLQVSQGLLATPLIAGLRFGWVSLIEFSKHLATALLVVGLVLVGAELLTFLAVPIPVGASALILTVLLARDRMPLRPAFDVRGWRELLRETLPFAVATALYVMYFRVILIITSLIAPAEETGYFAASFRVVEAVVVVPAVLIGAAFPIFARAARDDRERLRYAVTRVVEVALMAGAWAALSLALVAPFAIEVLGGAKFDDAVPVLRIQAVALVGSFLAAATGYALLSLRQYRMLLVVSVAGLALSVALGLALVPAHDAAGAAVAALVAELGVGALQTTLLLRTDLGMRLAPGRLAAVLVAAAAAVAAAAIPGLHELVMFAVASVVYFAVLAAFRQIPPELVEAFAARLRRRQP